MPELTVPKKSTRSSITVFPEEEIKAILTTELKVAAISVMSLHGTPPPKDESQIISMPTPIDSLVVLSLLSSVEHLLNVELSESVVRTGGYSSIGRALDHLLPSIKKDWAKKNRVS